MNNSIAGAAVAGLVGAVVAVVVVASGLANLGSHRGGKKLADAIIYIDSNGSGGCVINTIPQTLLVDLKGRVEWSILNRCGVTAGNDVEVKFKSTDPLDVKCNHKGKKAIKCDVSSAAAEGIYGYSVISGAYSEDPDLEIAP